jgi:biotin-(acetyl-CoA carboxylase) ligase
MPPDRPNIPVPDELADVRDKIRSLTEREEELRRLLLNNPDLREGAAWLAEIKTTQQSRTDLKELRAHHPDIAEQFTHPTPITRVVLTGISEDGELISARRMRKETTQ